MTAARHWTLLTVAALAWIPSHARAQAASRYETGFSADMVTLRDTQSGRTLISPSYQPIVNETVLKPEIRFAPRDNGFDITITYSNAGAKPVPMGTISIPGIRLGRTVSFRDFHAGTSPQAADHRNLDFSGPEFTYPSQMYSPVFVLNDDSTVLGMSLLYPVVEYNQPVGVQLISPGGAHAATGRNWEVQFHLSGDLPSGQTRRFTLAVRASPTPDEWVRTLLPYRDYFQSKYGPAQYARDPRPIAALTITDPFAAPEPGHPDLSGLNRFAQAAKERLSRGFARVIFRTPTGLFQVHPELNPPFQFMTRLSDIPAMRSSLASLRAVAGPGRSIGYCWGNSTLVMDGWDTGVSHTLEPGSKRDTARAFAELDAAAALNATVIVLDGFDRLSPADAYAWLGRLKQHAPQIIFVTSRAGEGGATADIYHILAPAMVQASDAENVLADLLIPGHESWSTPKDSPVAPAQQLEQAERAAAMGYVPIIPGDVSILGRSLNAAQSWRITLPEDLQPADQTDDSPPAAHASEQAPATGLMGSHANALPSPEPADPAPPLPDPDARHDPRRLPALRFSAPTFQPGSISEALDRLRISVFAKPRHKPLPKEAKAQEPAQPPL